MKPDIYKVELIGSGSLSVMAKPVSGEWIEDEFSNISSMGINRIVSLLEAHEAYELGLDSEKQLSEKYNMEFISYPIVDRGLPSSINEFLQFTNSLYHEVVLGLNIVIHCRAGIGRTGVVAAGILLHHGFDPKDAFDLISKQRRVEVPDTQAQIDWLIKAYKALAIT